MSEKDTRETNISENSISEIINDNISAGSSPGSSNEIYLDNAATTCCLPEAAKTMTDALCGNYGNPSSMHMKGVEAEKVYKQALDKLASIIKAKPSEIIITSGGTESDNMAIIGTAMSRKRRGMHIISGSTEHPAVEETCKFLQSLGFEISRIPVDKKGRADMAALKSLIREDTILVSLMHVNNETGTINPISEAAAIIKSSNPNTLFHVDAVQGFCKEKLFPGRAGVDMVSVSAHKFHGPKGVGFLYKRDGVNVTPIIYGGGQQKGLRSGTENVPGIAAMAEAASIIFRDMDAHHEYFLKLKKLLVQNVMNSLTEVYINGYDPLEEDPDGVLAAPHILNMSFEGIRSEVLLHALEDKGIYVSSGSACASNRPHTSRTLTAMGIKGGRLDSAIRFSFSIFNTEEHIVRTTDALAELVPMLRRYTRH